MEGLKAGRIVYYVFDAKSAAEVNRRRTTGESIKNRINEGSWPLGAQAHIGPAVIHGDICPAMVVGRPNDTSVNLKVMLDAADDYWAQNVTFDTERRDGTWHWMFDGQAVRYDASKQQ